MDRRWWLLAAMYLTYLIHEVWTLFPGQQGMLQPFPFSDQEVSLQYYIFGASEYLIWVIWAAVVHALFTDAREVTKWFLIFQIAEFFEYFLTYNEALFFVPNPIIKVGINITTIKIVTMFLLVTKKAFQWKLGK